MDNRQNLKFSFDAFKQSSSANINLLPTPGKLTFPNKSVYEFVANDLIEKGSIGMSSCGSVIMKMIHKPSKNIMAVKRVRAHKVDLTQKEQMLRELKIIQSQTCDDIVQFYGAVFEEGDYWICMELLDCSLDKFYRAVYNAKHRFLEKPVGFIATAVVRALNYLKESLNIIHRGYLVDSLAKTQDVGCQVYLAPERFTERVYDIRSDVWSLGISLVEICIGRFPYSKWTSVFDQLQSVVYEDPPVISADYYSPDLVDFVNKCLIKEQSARPKYRELMQHKFFIKHNYTEEEQKKAEQEEFGQYVSDYLNTISPVSE